MSALRLVLMLIVGVVLLPATSRATEPPRFMLKVKIKNRLVEGMPVKWSDDEVHLLARDGRLWQFAPNEASDFHKTSPTFRGYSYSEMRGELQREFGTSLEVSGTGHYLVVHPAGQRDQWADRFEELYRSFVHYFAVRGFTVRQPEFPLVAIVVKNQSDMARYAAAEGIRVGPGLLGYYLNTSNRVILYDQGGKPSDAHWSEYAATIIHEATHQTAFNTGVHDRLAMPPRWLAEGLGTLFEAPGVWDSRNHPSRADRLNRGRLENFQKGVAPKLTAGALGGFVATDDLFESQPDAAYAIAWALTFYLSETQPRQFSQYLAKTAARPRLVDYTPQERVRDFQALFGKDMPMLHARFMRYLLEQE